MICSEMTEKLEELSPLCYAEEWDNVGLLAGRRDKEITSVMIALDATDEVIDEAVFKGVSMLLTHHPMIFGAMKRITDDDFTGRRLVKLLRQDICYYAMHTNFDVMGMADAAADVIHLSDRAVLDVTYRDGTAEEGIGRVGRLPRSMSLEECARFVKDRFNLSQVKVSGKRKTAVKRAAICPGSGKSTIQAAIRASADVLITGDIGHHEGIDATAQGLCIIDAGHYGLEKIFTPYMEEYLKRELPGLEVYRAVEEEPFYYV